MEETQETKPAEKQAPLSREGLDVALANMFSGDNYQLDYVFYGHMISQCSIRLERMKAPAAVSFNMDHYNLHINPEKFDDFSLEEKLAVLKHEMLHILNHHVQRTEDRNHTAWNYSTDCAINQLINQSHLPQDCILPSNFPSKKKVQANQTSEQYYELLDKNDMSEDEPQSQSGQGGGHEKWGESEGDAELQKDITKNMIEKSIEQTQKSRGDLPSEIANYINLFSRKSELNWKKVLKTIVGNKKVNSRKTILRRDRRNPGFEHIKGKTKDRMFDLLFVGDESGSMSDEALTTTIGEVLNICTITKTPIWYVPVDSRAHKPFQLKSKQRTFNRSACGGTNLSPALDMAASHRIKYNAVVVLTDGYLCESDVAKFEALHLPVIWLIEPNGQIMQEMSYGKMKAFKLKDKSNENS